jgi:hypothetical protein
MDRHGCREADPPAVPPLISHNTRRTTRVSEAMAPPHACNSVASAPVRGACHWPRSGGASGCKSSGHRVSHDGTAHTACGRGSRRGQSAARPRAIVAAHSATGSPREAGGWPKAGQRRPRPRLMHFPRRCPVGGLRGVMSYELAWVICSGAMTGSVLRA